MPTFQRNPDSSSQAALSDCSRKMQAARLRLIYIAETNRQDILDGSLPLYVDGWCNSLDSEKENLRMAAIRSSRVKSELIVRGGIKEECFITRNRASDGDWRYAVTQTNAALHSAGSEWSYELTGELPALKN